MLFAMFFRGFGRRIAIGLGTFDPYGFPYTPFTNAICNPNILKARAGRSRRMRPTTAVTAGSRQWPGLKDPRISYIENTKLKRRRRGDKRREILAKTTETPAS
jgi:hypothetical protein